MTEVDSIHVPVAEGDRGRLNTCTRGRATSIGSLLENIETIIIAGVEERGYIYSQ